MEGPVSKYNFVKLDIVAYQEEDMPKPIKVPRRLAYVKREVAEAIPSWLRGTDFWRSPQMQLTAMKTRRGAQWVGYSGHGNGNSIDLNVEATMQLLNVKRKAALDEQMRKCGFVCHRLDGEMAFECWHYNYLPDVAFAKVQNLQSAFGQYTFDQLDDAMIKEHEKEWEALEEDTKAKQWALQKLGFYTAGIDGIWGKKSKAAFSVFEDLYVKSSKKARDWRRVLSFMTADFVVIGNVGPGRKFEALEKEVTIEW